MQPIAVTGGSDGIAARCHDMRESAAAFGAAAAEAGRTIVWSHALLVHPAVTSSALFDPLGFARFEGDLVAALDGPTGLTWTAARCESVDLEVRAAALAYEATDHLAGSVRDEILGALLAAPALGAASATLARTRDPMAAAQVAFSRDPQVADLIVNTLGLPSILAGTARVVPDGHGAARDRGLDRSPEATAAPRRLTDVLTELGHRDADPGSGVIDVRILTLPDGTRRAIVDITGTRSWTPFPTGDVTSLTTNGRALVGATTAYEGGVLAAMRQAGVGRGDPVLLVGHSEGGMVAVNTARDAARTGEFRVTHVIAAGSPVGRTVGSLPAHIQVLALENSKDLVPHLDGVANPDRPNVVTASSAHGDGTIVGDHDLTGSYLGVAGDAQQAGNPSIRHFLASAGSYFSAETVDTHTFQVTRRY